MEINEYEAEMLDTVLEAFAGRDELEWTQLMELFDGDEELAAAITDILSGMGLVTKTGKETQTGLPEKIIRNEAAVLFMQQGGFSAQVTPAQPVEAPISATAKPAKEIIFEIEPPIVEELQFVHEPEPAEEIQPLDPLAEAIPVSELAEVAVEQPTPVIVQQPTIEEAAREQVDLLQQETVKLRNELSRCEHKLREKDATIHTLAAHNEVLGRFRIFIWVLLGVIILLVAGLIFRAH